MKQYSPYKHIIESRQFDPAFLETVFELTSFMKKNEYRVHHELKNKIIAMLFYEASTRTRLSFESAALRLGAGKIHTENAREFSSAAKGETLEDTIRVISQYCDFLVIRHEEDGVGIRAAAVSDIPIINAGTGKLRHPTQALLDVYTIEEHFKRTSNLKVTLVGDLLRGRTCHSLIYLLSRFSENSFNFVAPDNCRVTEDTIKYLQEKQIEFKETKSLSDAISDCDVVYMTRIQRERFVDENEYRQARGKYVLQKKHLELLNEKSIIMHPLPRVDEIDIEIDDDPRARYFEQARNGLYVRMALLKLLNDYN